MSRLSKTEKQRLTTVLALAMLFVGMSVMHHMNGFSTWVTVDLTAAGCAVGFTIGQLVPVRGRARD